MPFSITHMDSHDKLAQRVSWPILEQFYPRERLERLIQTHVKQTTVVRKLSVVITHAQLLEPVAAPAFGCCLPHSHQSGTLAGRT